MKNRIEKPIICKYSLGTTSGNKKEWKTILINGYKTNYAVRANGDVKNRRSDRMIHRYLSNRGNMKYYYYTFSIDGKSYTINLHRLLAALFIPIPSKYRSIGYNQSQLEVTAKDGNLLNIDLNNLEWITTSERTQRCVDNANGSVGERCHLSKMTEDTAKQICEMLQEGRKAKYIRDHISGVTDSMLYGIKYHATWKNIAKEYVW